MIKAIIFDLGGVLFTDGSDKFINDLSALYKLDKKYATEVINGEIGSKYRESKISRDKFWKLVLEKLNIKDSSDNLEEMWLSCYEQIEGTKEIILELSKEYKVYYLSDNVKERVNRLDSKFNYLRLFDGGVFSHEVGVRKPNPKIYKLLLRKTNAKPEETIYIDDKDWCLKPARKMRIITILFKNPDDLGKKLNGLLVN